MTNEKSILLRLIKMLIFSDEMTWRAWVVFILLCLAAGVAIFYLFCLGLDKLIPFLEWLKGA